MLRLVAVDEGDMSIISAHMQDAVMRREDLSFDAKRRRFGLVANRFIWNALPEQKRCRVGLHFDDVASVKVQGLDLASRETVLSLLAINCEKVVGLSAYVTLAFSGNFSIRLEVDCINAALDDLSTPWTTTKIPEHTI